MSYVAKIRTGKNPLTIQIKKPKLICGAGESFKLKKGKSAASESFERLIVPAEEACCMLREYASRRDLVLGYDEGNGSYVLFNPRYRTFRFIHLHDGGYDLLSFIEAEFVTVERR